MTDTPPYGETVNDSRPAILSWDRCDSDGGYFGVIYNPENEEVIHFTYDYPVKSPVGHAVVDWMALNGYTHNRDTWDWERQCVKCATVFSGESTACDTCLGQMLVDHYLQPLT